MVNWGWCDFSDSQPFDDEIRRRVHRGDGVRRKQARDRAVRGGDLRRRGDFRPRLREQQHLQDLHSVIST